LDNYELESTGGSVPISDVRNEPVD